MKKGFTLIELLAVIVILAIIALIAVPVIMNIIEDSQKSANERSIDMYAKAAKIAIAKYAMDNNGKMPSSFEEIKDHIDYDGAEIICDKKLIKADGTVYLSGCTVGGTPVEGYEYGKNPTATPEEGETICTPVTGDDLNYKYVYYANDHLLGQATYTTGTKSIGDAYRCQVNDEDSYIFNIIGQDVSGNYNLMLNHNLGLPSDASPETVATTLFTLTGNWTNIPVRTDSYSGKYDELKSGDDGFTQLTKQYTFNYSGHYARLIEYSELLNFVEEYPNPQQTTWISSVPKDRQTAEFNDWTYLSSSLYNFDTMDYSWGYNGLSCGVFACSTTTGGIRPVITVPASAIQ